MVDALVSRMDSMINLPRGIHHYDRDRCLMNVQPNNFSLLIEGTPFVGDHANDRFRWLFKTGEFAVFAEVSPQYNGVNISDASFEPYFALAEELDIRAGYPGRYSYGGRPSRGGVSLVA